MLCILLNSYTPPCNNTSGGVNRGWVFDPSDFTFTAGALDANGQSTGYSALALRAGSGASLGTVVTAGNVVISVPVSAGGTNYPYAQIPITFTGGGGTGAAAYAVVVGGVVTSIVVTAGGSGYTTPPTAALSVTGATTAAGGRLFAFNFHENTGKYTWDNPESETCSTSFKHQFDGKFIGISQEMNNMLEAYTQAGCCCGLGYIFELNSGKILVMGEKYVGNVEQQRFKVKLSSKGDSGMKYEDFNGADVTLKGDFIRPLRTFTGGVSALLAFV